MVSLKDGADLGLGGDGGGCGEGGNGRIIQAVGVVVVGECVIEGVELFGEVGECLDGDGPHVRGARGPSCWSRCPS